MNMKIGRADECGMPPGIAVERVRNKEPCVFATCDRDSRSKHMFSHLLPAPVIEGQRCRLPSLRRRRTDGQKMLSESKTDIVQPHRVEPNGEETSTRDKNLPQLWVSCVKNETDVTNATQMKAEFSYAFAVVDKIDDGHEEEERIEGVGRHDGNRIGGELAACIWIF